MHFAKVCSLLLGTASITAMAQSVSPGEAIILAIDAVTCLSQANLEVANNITEENALELGGVLVENFGGIVKKVTGALSNVTVLKTAAEAKTNTAVGSPVVRASNQVRQIPGAISSVDQHAICNSLRSFVFIHQQLLAVVIGEKGILSATPFTAPLAVILRSLEGVVDTFAFAVIALVPGCSPQATQLNGFLSPTLSDAASAYP